MTLRNMMLGKKQPEIKGTYCMIPFLQNSKVGQSPPMVTEIKSRIKACFWAPGN